MGWQREGEGDESGALTILDPQNWCAAALAPIVAVVMGILVNASFVSESVGCKSKWGPGTSLLTWFLPCHVGLSLMQFAVAALATLVILLTIAVTRRFTGKDTASVRTVRTIYGRTSTEG